MADLEQRLKELEDRVAILEGATTLPSPAQASAKKQSPKEFLLTVAPKSAVEKTLAVAYYYEVETGRGAFNTDDLDAVFRAAKEKSPSNMGDMVNKNVRKGYVMEDAEKKDNKKAWVLTATGERCIADSVAGGGHEK